GRRRQVSRLLLDKYRASAAQPRMRAACLLLAAALEAEEEAMAREIVANIGHVLILGGNGPPEEHFDPLAVREYEQRRSKREFPAPVKACIDGRRCYLWFGWAVKDLAVGLDRQQATALAAKLTDALSHTPDAPNTRRLWEIGLVAAGKELAGRMGPEQASRLTSRMNAVVAIQLLDTFSSGDNVDLWKEFTEVASTLDQEQTGLMAKRVTEAMAMGTGASP